MGEQAPDGAALPALGLETYTFRQDWYFFVGDNQLDSRDSRYFGFVPAEFVIGIVPGR